MKLLICIDDTDTLYSIGTGTHALIISEKIADRRWGRSSFISRHQLYVHRDIPYTSHNSTMCFEVYDVGDGDLRRIKEFCMDYLERESAIGSDPGLCIVVADTLRDRQRLIDYGKRAKGTVLTKKEAYDTAAALGVHLSEHGGTGGGVIGALAGPGLRLSGNDGRIKGKYLEGHHGEVFTVKEILHRTNIDEIREERSNMPLGEREEILIGKKVKGVFLDNKIILLVEDTGEPIKQGAKWQTLPRSKVGKY